MRANRPWVLLAALAAGIAVAVTLHVGLSAARHRAILARKQQDLAAIQQFAGRWAPEEAWRDFLESQRAYIPADLEDIATRTLGANQARITLRPAEVIADGWQRRSAAVELANVNLAEAITFLSTAAETSPAWRLREITVRATAQPGHGAMSVVLETLEKRL